MRRTRLHKQRTLGVLIAGALAVSVVSSAAHIHGPSADSPLTCAVCVATTAISKPASAVQLPPANETRASDGGVPQGEPAVTAVRSSLRARAPPTSHT